MNRIKALSGKRLKLSKPLFLDFTVGELLRPQEDLQGSPRCKTLPRGSSHGFCNNWVDAGASILWDQPKKLSARESTVTLETFERLIQMPELLGLLDELLPQPSNRLTELDALARFQACLLILSDANEDRKNADDRWTREAASRRWSSARSLALDTICQARSFNLRRVFEYMGTYPISKKRLLVEDLGRRLGFDSLHNEYDHVPTNSVDILQARYKGLPDVMWSW